MSLLWVRNGWEDVHFIPEDPPKKTPDFCAKSNHHEWFVECKRMSMNSDYSVKERKKWLVLWSKVKQRLIEFHQPIVFDIIFHVELHTLPDDFVKDQLSGKIDFIFGPCTLISNSSWTVKVQYIDMKKIHDHLSEYYVKHPSDQLKDLIGGERRPNGNFTCILEGKSVRMGEGIGNNVYLETISFAVGAFWSCDADSAIEKKARDVRKKLSTAINQLPEDKNSAIHIGIETLDDLEVESQRYFKIFDTVQKFDSNNKKLRWVYCHLFQSYSPPDKAWVFDETIYYFTDEIGKSQKPLEVMSAIVPNDHCSEGGVHWLKDPP